MRKTASEKLDYLRKFDQLVIAGEYAERAAELIGIPRQTLYRWRKNERSLTGTAARIDAGGLSIDEAIARLCSKAELERGQLLDASFKFLAWLRWPVLVSNHPLAILACATLYVSQKSDAETVADLDAWSLSFLARHLHLGRLRNLCSNIEGFPSFETGMADGQPFFEADALAILTSFLLNGGSDTGRQTPHTLRKAAFLFENNSFGNKKSMSGSTFWKMWSLNAPAAPFVFVERFHSEFDFSEMDPILITYADAIDRFLSDTKRRIAYFAACKSVVGAIQSVLPSNVVRRVSFPKFPTSLIAAPVAVPPLTARVEKAMSLYGKTVTRNGRSRRR